MIRRVVLCLVGLAALAVAAPAAAIINGHPSLNDHPDVGGLVAPKAYSDGTWIYCSGTLISPTVFLTAAHCDEGDDKVRVTFSSDFRVDDTVNTGAFYADPRYDQKRSDPHDIAVVVPDEPITGIPAAQLPKPQSLGDLPAAQELTSVGYGAYEVTNQPGGHRYLYDDVRMAAHGTLNATNPTWLRISMNPATGNGGTCYGDSGGPNFLAGTSTIAGTTITGDAICRSTNVVYRLDTDSARQFLGQYVTLPDAKGRPGTRVHRPGR